MYKPNDIPPGRTPHRGRRLAAVAAVAVAALAGTLLQLKVQAFGASRLDRIPQHDGPVASAQQTKSPGTYQLRCWQYGRLLFDESPVTLPAEAREGARLVAFDRNGAPVIVTDAGGTTCMARPSPNTTPSLALPR